MELTADEEVRVQRLCEAFGYSDEEARKMILNARSTPAYNSFGEIDFKPASGDGRRK